MSSQDQKSFDIGQWCDFVRGLLDEETETRMQQQLEVSAGERRRVLALRQVLDVAEHDSRHAPPVWAVRSAKALGSLRRSDESHSESMWQRLVMALSFDSLASPALVGTRDAQAQDRQLIYTSEGFRVDLRIEPEADFQSTVLVGQLVKTDGELTPVADVPVLAVKQGQVVAQTKSGRFGEFQSEGLPASGVGLWLLLDEDLCLEIELGHNTSDGNHHGESA